ncbi:hypothetical protein LPJ76_006445, partial [Coemansia sp. RSA 638]
RQKLLWPLEKLVPNLDAEPYLHPEAPSIPLPPVEFDESADAEAMGFQNTALEAEPSLRERLFEVHQPTFIGNALRFVANEHQITGYFADEVFERANAIIGSCHDSISVKLIEGHPTNHADIILQVVLWEKVGMPRVSLVVCEMKSPYGANKQLAPPECDDPAAGLEYVAAKTGMQTARSVRAMLGQLHAYARDTAKELPGGASSLWINRDCAILSTFNELWIARFEKDPANTARQAQVLSEQITLRQSTETEEARSAVEDARAARDAADVVRVSKQFCSDDTELHVSFALAYALDRVATDMTKNPEKYPRVPDSWLRDPANISMAAAGKRRRKTKTRSQKPKSGAGG